MHIQHLVMPEDDRDSPRPRLVGLEQNEQRGFIVTMEELHVNDVQQLLI